MMTDFAREMRVTREKTGMSFRRLGEHLDISFSTLARVERGAGEPDPHTRLVLLRWMHPWTVYPPCQCMRCQGRRPFNERLEALESQMEDLAKRLRDLEMQALGCGERFHFGVRGGDAT